VSVGTKELERTLPGDMVLQVFYPWRRRWGGKKQRRFLLLGARPDDGLRPLAAHGDLVDGTVMLDRGVTLAPELVQQIEAAVRP